MSIAVGENTNCSRNRRNEQAGSAKTGAGNGSRTGAEGDEPYEEELLVGEHPLPLRLPLVQPASRAPQPSGRFDDGVRGRRDSRNHLDGGVGHGGHRPVRSIRATRSGEKKKKKLIARSVSVLASMGVQEVKIRCSIEPVALVLHVVSQRLRASDTRLVLLLLIEHDRVGDQMGS